jgi:hypothetical protein
MPINDQIIVLHEVGAGSKVREMILEAKELVRGSYAEQNGKLVMRVINLNRPDTSDEGEINSYIERTATLFTKLQALSESVKIHVALFSFPKERVS